jgi:hypothetical protein
MSSAKLDEFDRRCPNHRQGEQVAAARADDAPVEDIPTLGVEDHDAADAHRGARSDDGADVARDADAVENDDVAPDR